MPKYSYTNVSDTFFLAFLAFGSILKHFHHTKSQLLLWDPGPA